MELRQTAPLWHFGNQKAIFSQFAPQCLSKNQKGSGFTKAVDDFLKVLEEAEENFCEKVPFTDCFKIMLYRSENWKEYL